MKKTVVLLGLLLFGLVTKAQEQERDRSQAVRDLLEESVSYYASDEYKSSMEVSSTFFDKINIYESNPPIGSNQNIDFTDWLTDNLTFTKFKTVEEGVQLFYQYEVTLAMLTEKHRILSERMNLLLQQLTKNEIIELYDDMFSDYIYLEAKESRKRDEMYNKYLLLSDTTAQIKHSNP